MSAQSDRNDRVNASHEAQTFMRNPLFVRAVEEVLTDIYNEWVMSEPGDPQARERLWWEQWAMGEIQKRLRKPIDEGTIASEEQNQHNFQRQLE